MKYLATILLIGFIGIATLGILGMHTGVQDHSQDCIAAIAKGIDCPEQITTLEYLTFHLETYKNLILTTLNEGLTSLVLLTFISLLYIYLAFLYPNKSQRLGYYGPVRSFSYNRGTQKFTDWLALHNNSPSLI